MKKERAATQCCHGEIARAVALGELLHPDGPEPRLQDGWIRYSCMEGTVVRKGAWSKYMAYHTLSYHLQSFTWLSSDHVVSVVSMVFHGYSFVQLLLSKSKRKHRLSFGEINSKGPCLALFGLPTSLHLTSCLMMMPRSLQAHDMSECSYNQPMMIMPIINYAN